MNTLKSSVQKERARAVGQEREEMRAWLQQEEHIIEQEREEMRVWLQQEQRKIEQERERMKTQLQQEHEGDKALQSAIRAAENKGKKLEMVSPCSKNIKKCNIRFTIIFFLFIFFIFLFSK